MSKLHTHYDNLKVARSAPPEVIQAAYRALSLKHHPDHNPGDPEAVRIMPTCSVKPGSFLSSAMAWLMSIPDLQ